LAFFAGEDQAFCLFARVTKTAGDKQSIGAVFFHAVRVFGG